MWMLSFLPPSSISVRTNHVYSYNIWWIFVCSSNLTVSLPEGTLPQLGALQRQNVNQNTSCKGHYKLQINVPTDATNFISLFLMFPLTLHVLGLYWPIIRGVLSCCYATIWLLPCLLTVRASVEVALEHLFVIYRRCTVPKT
jgi:hypothetical protein